MPLFLTVLSTFFYCEYSLKSIREIIYHLHRIERDPENMAMHREIVRFSCQLKHQKIQCNARRFLNVDFRVLKGVSELGVIGRRFNCLFAHLQIIASIAVYLVIIVQFMPRTEKIEQINKANYI